MAAYNPLVVHVTASLGVSTQHPADHAHEPRELDYDHAFSSSYTRVVTTTVNITGRLPNAIFTLPAHVVHAIGAASEVQDYHLWPFVCHKFYLAQKEFLANKRDLADKRITVSLDCGRLYIIGACFRLLHLVRVPTVLDVWHEYAACFIKTARGMYACGINKSGLGLGHTTPWLMPERLPIEMEVQEVIQFPTRTLFRTNVEWLGCGNNSYGALGLGNGTHYPTPTAFEDKSITRWAGADTYAFAWTPRGVMACGRNVANQCGVFGRNDPSDGMRLEYIKELTPVRLPDDVKANVDQIVCTADDLFPNMSLFKPDRDRSTFFICGRRCFACGTNMYGELGIGTMGDVLVPTELPMAVDQVISCNYRSVFRSGDSLVACGYNCNGEINSTEQYVVTPAPLHAPVDTLRVFITEGSFLLELADGSWVGRGDWREMDQYGSIADDSGRIDPLMWSLLTVFDVDHPDFARPGSGRVMALPGFHSSLHSLDDNE